VLQSCNTLIERFANASMLRRLVSASSIERDFSNCDQSLTKLLSELGVSCSIQLASELRASLRFQQMDLERVQSDVNRVQGDVKDMGEEMILLKDQLALI
jgi:hypothetical protein